MRRNAAKSALQQADTDHRLRRALLRRYASANIRLAVGQTCFYWRNAQQADLVKIRWRGPAKVLMVEDDEQGNASTYWICHKLLTIAVLTFDRFPTMLWTICLRPKKF